MLILQWITTQSFNKSTIMWLIILLVNHSLFQITINKIKSKKWDVVVLQEQSQIPSWGEDFVCRESVVPLQSLMDVIRENSADTVVQVKTLFSGILRHYNRILYTNRNLCNFSQLLIDIIIQYFSSMEHGGVQEKTVQAYMTKCNIYYHNVIISMHVWFRPRPGKNFNQVA